MCESENFITQFEKGNGMDRRNHNIQEIIKLKKQGKSDDDIINIAGLYLRDVTIREYLKIAKYHIKNGNTQANTTDKKETSTSKFTNTCKNCGNSIPDNTTFCNKDCVEQYKNKKENLTNCEPESFAEYAKKHPHENK